jgi:hypothetical protein
MLEGKVGKMGRSRRVGGREGIRRGVFKCALISNECKTPRWKLEGHVTSDNANYNTIAEYNPFFHDTLL